MKKYLTIKNALIAGLVVTVVILSLLTQCNGDRAEKPTSDTLTFTDTVRDLRICSTEVAVPIPVFDTVIIPPEPIDSLAVVMAYFTEQEYNIVLADDSDLYAQYNPTVYMNHITGGDFIRQIRRPIAINTTTIIDNTIKPKKWHWYVGASVGGSLNSFELSPGIMIQYKGFLFGVNYGIMQKSITIPIYYELARKRK